MLGLQVNINYKWHIVMHIILMQQHYNAHPKPSPTTNEANGKVLTDFKKRIKVFISKDVWTPKIPLLLKEKHVLPQQYILSIY